MSRFPFQFEICSPFSNVFGLVTDFTWVNDFMGLVRLLTKINDVK